MSTVREKPSWYQDWFPEWRTGPPWVMRDMVFSQPAVAAIQLADDAPARALAAELAGAAEAEAPISVVACGTSEHATQAVAELLDAALERPRAVEARQAFDAALSPRAGGLCLAVSHGGMSKATVSALEAARAAGARTALITAVASAPTHALADLVVTTPKVDASWCHTIGYTSPILVGAQAGAILAGGALEAAAVSGLIEATLELERAATEIGAGASGIQRVLVGASGIDEPAGRELALKIAEGAHVPAAMLELENVLHGHLAAHDAGSLLVVIVADEREGGRRAQRAEQVLRAARRIGLRTALIVAAPLAGQIDPEVVSEGRLVLPVASGVGQPLAAVLATAVALQLLTLGVVLARGTNPDLLHRDEEPWWEAIAAGESKFPRQ